MRFSAAVGRCSVAIVAGAVLAAGSAATAAATAAPPSIRSFGCEGGGGIYFCFVSFTGGVAPVSIRWFKDGSPVSAFYDRSFLLQMCLAGTSAAFRVVVTDSGGGSDEADGRFPCTLL